MALLVIGLLSSSTAFAPSRAAAPIQSHEALRSRRSAVRLADADSPAKITIRPPSESAAANGAAGAAKVTVRVRQPSERATTDAATVAPPPIAIEDDSASTKVTIKAPAKKPAAAPPPPAMPDAPPLTEAEQSLLDATQRANCSSILDALQAGANPNVRDPKGRTPLHFVAGVGLAPAAMLLIHFGAQIDVRDADGLTPMHMAAGYANAQTLRVLVAAGAQTDIKGDAQGTPFDIVCALGDYQLTQVSGNRFKKKDDKLEKLKACMDVLDDPEAAKAEADWDEMLTEVLKAISPA